MRSPSLNIRREKYRNDAFSDSSGNGAEHLAATTVSDEELLLAIEHEFELNDGNDLRSIEILNTLLRHLKSHFNFRFYFLFVLSR